MLSRDLHLRLCFQTYLPKTRLVEGVYGFKDGYEYYRQLLQWHLSVDMDPMKVYDLGLSEVARIKANMENVSWLFQNLVLGTSRAKKQKQEFPLGLFWDPDARPDQHVILEASWVYRHWSTFHLTLTDQKKRSKDKRTQT